MSATHHEAALVITPEERVFNNSLNILAEAGWQVAITTGGDSEELDLEIGTPASLRLLKAPEIAEQAGLIGPKGWLLRGFAIMRDDPADRATVCYTGPRGIAITSALVRMVGLNQIKPNEYTKQ